MNASEIHAKLPKQSLLHALGKYEFEVLLNRARSQTGKKGDVLLRQGDKGDFLVILIQGQVRVTVFTANGREIVLEYAGPGMVLGEIALLDGGERTASVIAMEDVDYLVLTRSMFETLVAANHQIALRLMREMASRLRLTNQMVENDRAYAAAPRLARFLIRLVRNDSKGGKIIALSQTELSLFAGISRENINRQLGLWAQAGIVSVEQGHIRILDMEPLEEIADAME